MVACSLLATLDPGTAKAQFHVSRLDWLSRTAVTAGESFDLTVHGDKLDEVESLVFSHPAIQSQLSTTDPLPLADQRQPQYGQFHVVVPAEVPAGRYEVRAVGRHGLTNPRAFLVSTLPCAVADAVSRDRNAPTPLVRDQWHQSVAAANSIDWYALEIAAGDSLQIELLAQRLDSAMIGELKLYDPAGKAIATARGTDNLDPVLVVDGLAAGTYVLAVRDFTYRGGNEFQYQLVARAAGATTDLVSGGPGVPGQLPVHWLPSASHLPAPSSEPTVEPPDDSLVSIPHDSTRWFAAGHADHVYRFAAEQGQSLAIEVVSQRITEPTDARLIIQRAEPQPDGDPQLHHVSHVDDSPEITDGVVQLGSKDPQTLFVAPAASSYRMLLRDLDIGTTLRARQKYRIRIAAANPRFDLVAYRVFPAKDVATVQAFASKLYRAGSEMIRVFAIRRDGWTGPIRVSIDNLPAGVSCADAWIAADQTQTQLTLVASEQAAGSASSIRIQGHSEDGKQVQEAVPLTIVRGRGQGRNFVPTRITTSLPVAVSETDLAPITLSVGDASTPEVKPGATLPLSVHVIRREGGKTPCVLRPQNLPAGIGADEVTVAADASEGKIELKPNPSTKPGIYSVWFQVETKIKVRPNPQALERAQAYRAHLQTLHDDPAQAANLEAIKAAITAADKRVEAAQGSANEQELTVFIPTNHTTFRVALP